MPDSSTLPPGPRDAGLLTYSDTVARGLYEPSPGGLRGKHDNVRTYWEDRLTRSTLRAFAVDCDRKARSLGRGVRIADLGCGAGQGYELLTRIDRAGLDLGDTMEFVLPPARVGLYLGLDFSEAMVDQGRRTYGGVPGARFERADLRDRLTVLASEPPFDIYFSSYGALSHLEDRDLVRCLTGIVAHAAPGSLVVLDLLGRYSPEWPGYWHVGRGIMLPYSMSYLYDEEAVRRGEVERFPLRFWTGDEVRELCGELEERTGTEVEVATLFDRSVVTGRHVDTLEFGCTLPPLRRLVNRLYEQNLRTDLGRLRIADPPRTGLEPIDRFFSTHAECWNRIVDFTLERVAGARIDLVGMDGWRDFPPALQLALLTMDRIVDSIAWIDVGDTRANMVEPQLAYVLQRLEHALQAGLGCGHGLVAVLRIGPPA